MAENKIIPKHWLVNKFEDLLDYIQPTPYIVESTEYSEDYKTPVLTAGKSFVLGKTNEVNGIFNSLPVIIFDDFTTANKFVNFSFKVKSSAMKILKAKSETVNIKFVYYYMQTIRVTIDTHKRYWISVFSKLPIPSPTFVEQLAIVSKIEELLSDLENGKQQLQTAQQQLKVYRQSLLKAAFEGKLTRLNHDPPDLLDEHDLNIAAESQIEYIKNQGSDNLPKGDALSLPKGWKRVTVNDVCLKIIGGGTPSTKIEKYWNGNIPWISSADIYGIKDIKPRRKITNEAIVNSAANLLPKGGIIVVTRVGLGKLAVAPYDLCFSQDSQGLVLNKKHITKEFALWVLHQQVQIFKYQSRGTTINGVTKKQLSDLAFHLPPLEEQKLIVQEIESKLTVCDKMEETISQSLQRAETLWQSILKKAFEGRLV